MTAVWPLLGIWIAIFTASIHKVTLAAEPSGTIVFPRVLEGRSGDAENMVLKVKDDLTLNLGRSQVFSENFIVRTHTEDNELLEHFMKAENIEKHLYHDATNMASVSVKEENGLQVEGILGEKLRIRPLPERERSEEGHVAHLLFEVDDDNPHQYDYVVHDSGIEVSERQIMSRSQDIPKRIHPEIYIMMDSEYVASFTKGLESIIFYLGVMINAVNLRYLGVKDPAVRNRIVGVELLSHTQDSEVIVRTRAGGKLIRGTPTLSKFRNYMNRNHHRYKWYDIVFFVTSLDIVEEQGRGIVQYAGFAYVGAVCTDGRVGIAEDISKTWIGVRAIAHEVGHLLGCPHDGDAAPGLLGNAPGSRHCPWSDGYLMSYITANRNQFQLSSCCKAMISYLARFRGRECMVRIDVNITYNKQVTLPGKYINPDKQCKILLPFLQGTRNLPGDHDKDCRMRCFVPKTYYGFETFLEQRPLDGTSCANNSNQVCTNGLCKHHPNIRPE